MLHLVSLTTPVAHQRQLVDDTTSSYWQQSVAMSLAMEVPATLQQQGRHDDKPTILLKLAISMQFTAV